MTQTVSRLSHSILDRAVAQVRSGPLQGRWLFAWVFFAQLGHLIEHISVAIQGKGLLGSQFNSELSHLLFNSVIAILSVVLVVVYPRNPWVYPLVLLTIFHGVEHIYIYERYLEAGVTNGQGLLGRGGAIGIIPLDRLDLHNVYNGFEMILMVLGFGYETEGALADEEV